MSEPHVVSRKPYSPAVIELTMSDGGTLYGCSWPGCNFAATEKVNSISSHHKSHTGQAAQRRRARRRPKAETPTTNNILEAAFALLDRAQELVDALDSWDSDFEAIKQKADRWDALRESLKDGT